MNIDNPPSPRIRLSRRHLLGIGAAMKQMLANLVSVGDSATRLISIGTAGGVSVERSLVLSDRDAQPVLLEVQTRVLR